MKRTKVALTVKVKCLCSAEISLDNDGTLIINNVNSVKANLNSDSTCPSCDNTEGVDIGSAATDMLDEYAESLSKKRLSQLLNFREADGILIEKYWADTLVKHLCLLNIKFVMQRL